MALSPKVLWWIQQSGIKAEDALIRLLAVPSGYPAFMAHLFHEREANGPEHRLFMVAMLQDLLENFEENCLSPEELVGAASGRRDDSEKLAKHQDNCVGSCLSQVTFLKQNLDLQLKMYRQYQLP
jgi:hypothetical protein